jgi:tyrosine-specific transport protein
MKEKGLWYATFTLVGVIVGAGVLGLPYVMAQYGFLTALLTILLTLIILIPSSLAIGEVLERTKGKHQLASLAEKYLGKKGKISLIIFMFIGIYAALIAYCFGAGQTLSTIFGGNSLYFSIGFWAILSAIAYFKLNVIAKAEIILNPFKILVLFVFGAIALTKINVSNLIDFNMLQILSPLGVVLFSLMGIYVIPTAYHELTNKKYLKKAIIYSTIISAVVYIIFAASMVGVMGTNTPEVSTIGLESLGSTFLILINLFATIALATAFIGLSYSLKETFMLDLKFKNFTAWFWVALIPLAIILLKPTSFIHILGISGTLGGGLATVVILSVHKKAQESSKGKPTYSIYLPWFIRFVIIAIMFIATYQEIMALF